MVSAKGIFRSKGCKRRRNVLLFGLPEDLTMRQIFCVVFFFSTIGMAVAQVSPDAKTDVQLEVLKARIEAQEREVAIQQQQVDKRLQEQLDAINRRFDDAAAAMNKLLALLTLFGAVGSAFAFTTWFKGRADYIKERKGQETLVEQQVDIGKKLMEGSGELVKYQIESVGKLRDVIGLVAESFSLQVKREKGLEEFTALAADLNEHYKTSYARARDGILSLKVSRMGWATLPLTKFRIAERARAEFHTIPERFLKLEAEGRPLEFAGVCQRIGTAAFYANDIEYGRELLTRAWTIYDKYEQDKGSFPDDQLMARIATAFFLGLVAKSWIGESQSIDHALGEAKKWFDTAVDLLRRNKIREQTEFQIPVTQAEVLSYMEGTRADARKLLGTMEEKKGNAIIYRLQAMTTRDEYQQQLLCRACLIRGNLEQVAGKAGIDYYEAARLFDSTNAYATLSLAMVTSDTEKRPILFRESLEALKPYLEKQEVTARALAHAWAAIAAHELGDEITAASHLKHLRSIRESGIIEAGDKQPLFFNPISKMLARLDELIEAIAVYLGGSAAKVATASV